jgi:RNA-binding protein
MDELSGSQKRWLRGRAHGLKPVVRIGKQGLTASALAEVELALASHELIKIHSPGSREEKQATAQHLEEQLAASAVGAIGNVVILFRPSADPEKRVIHLPTGSSVFESHKPAAGSEGQEAAAGPKKKAAVPRKPRKKSPPSIAG